MDGFTLIYSLETKVCNSDKTAHMNRHSMPFEHLIIFKKIDFYRALSVIIVLSVDLNFALS